MTKKRNIKFILKLLVASVCSIAIGIALAVIWFVNQVSGVLLPDKPVLTNSADKQAVKILFIGNSLTFINILPAVLAKFIESELHRPTKIYQQTVGGATLDSLWRLGTARRTITQSGPWDYVVLQGGSKEPLGEKNQQTFYEYAKRFDGIIKANHAKTILFETWADKSDKKAQQAITLTYNNLSKQIGATVIPIGQSFFYVEANDKSANLYSEDNHHPSQSGTYLAACLFYYYLFDVKTRGTLPDKILFYDEDKKKDFQLIDLNEKQAKALQDLAWKFYLSAHKAGS